MTEKSFLFGNVCSNYWKQVRIIIWLL